MVQSHRRCRGKNGAPVTVDADQRKDGEIGHVQINLPGMSVHRSKQQRHVDDRGDRDQNARGRAILHDKPVGRRKTRDGEACEAERDGRAKAQGRSDRDRCEGPSERYQKARRDLAMSVQGIHRVTHWNK